MTPTFTEEEHAAMVAKVGQAMDTTQPMDGRCNAPTHQAAGRCRRQAGWGTPNATGPCKNHGGKLPNVERHHAQITALTFARGQLGQELDVDPLEGVLMAVRLSYGIVDHWRHRLHINSSDAMRDGYAKAIADYGRMCEIAIKAGVAERQIRIVERFGEQLSLAFEEVMAAMRPSDEQRGAAVDAWVNVCARLEAPVIDSTAEDVAA